jgi:hypothetical protein
MPLSWNEIRSRAHEFSRRWAGEASERAEAQSFWNEFFAIFGLDRKRVASFEKQVKLSRAGEKLKQGRIDAFWKGTLLIEHKSAGQDLDRAFAQAIDYFEGLPGRDLSRYILVSDFTRFRLCDLEADTDVEFRLADLYDPVAMPPALVKAHQKLDAAVDAAYGRKGFANDAARVAFLFEKYRRLTSL